jgi:hypothetical protein
MQVHRFGVASGQDEDCAFAVLGADRAEDISRGGSLIFGCAWTRTAPGPAADAFMAGSPREGETVEAEANVLVRDYGEQTYSIARLGEDEASSVQMAQEWIRIVRGRLQDARARGLDHRYAVANGCSRGARTVDEVARSAPDFRCGLATRKARAHSAGR